MYVCICHAIRCRDIREIAGNGGCRAGDIFRHFDVGPKCGRCVPTIREMLQTAANTNEDESLQSEQPAPLPLEAL